MARMALLAISAMLLLAAAMNLWLSAQPFPTGSALGTVQLVVEEAVAPPTQPPGAGPSPGPMPGPAAAPSLIVNVITPTSANIIGTGLGAGSYSGDLSNATGLGISGMSFDLSSGAPYFKIIIEKVDRPAGVEPKETNFQYVQISVVGTAPEKISNIGVTVKVDKAWIGLNRIDKDSIVLSYWDNGWRELGMTKAGEDGGYMYYRTNAPGIGLYAISGKKSPLVAIPMPGLPILQVSVLISELNLLILAYPLMFAMIILALVLFFLLVMYGRRIRAKIRRMEIIETLKNLLKGRKKVKR
ncbi:MAG: PGF-pre-PGF domain-containing protein [Candidatus Aenigmatarchaeota archaeon]